MYRMPVTAFSTGGADMPARRAGRAGRALRFATVAIDQFCGGPWREPDVRPLFEGVTSLDGRANHTGRDELVEPTTAARSRRRAGGNKLGYDAAVRRDRDTFARLNPPYVATQIVLQLADARRRHVPIIATCGHTCNARFVDVTPSWTNQVGAL